MHANLTVLLLFTLLRFADCEIVRRWYGAEKKLAPSSETFETSLQKFNTFLNKSELHFMTFSFYLTRVYVIHTLMGSCPSHTFIC